MAEADADLAGLSDTFSKCCIHGTTDKSKKTITTKNVNKWFKDCGLYNKKLNSNSVDIMFSKHKTKGCNELKEKEFHALLGDVAKESGQTVAAVVEKLKPGIDAAKGTTKTSKTGGVEKMTDTSKYTGAHKERFDKDGKGKGAAGRKDEVNTSGYVGNYKGEGTFDKK